MCCFSREVRWVGRTAIFARGGEDAVQHLVYAMAYAADAELAMVLPLPVASGTGEGGLRFVDLSGYPNFFDHMQGGFPDVSRYLNGTFHKLSLSGRSQLDVVDVGAFEASFVPAIGDFARLDERFRLGDELWRSLPRYAGYGFAVFKLRAGSRAVHPMALSFPRSDPTQVYFPTLHIHDNELHAEAQFDHELFLQSAFEIGSWETSWNAAPGTKRVWEAVESGEYDRTSTGWIRTMFGEHRHDPALRLAAGRFMDLERAAGLVADRPVQRLTMKGRFLNQDVLVPDAPHKAGAAPRGTRPGLGGRGDEPPSIDDMEIV